MTQRLGHMAEKGKSLSGSSNDLIVFIVEVDEHEIIMLGISHEMIKTGFSRRIHGECFSQPSTIHC